MDVSKHYNLSYRSDRNGGEIRMNRRKTDDLPFWEQSVKRRDLLLAFLISAVFFGVTAGFGFMVQGVVTDNQCSGLSSNATTKLAVIDLLDEANQGRGNFGSTRRKTLDKEIRELVANAGKLQGCTVPKELELYTTQKK